MRKPVIYLARSDTNRAVWPQKMAKGFTFRILEVQGFQYLCSKNKHADQLHGSQASDLRLFCICKIRFSPDLAHIPFTGKFPN